MIAETRKKIRKLMDAKQYRSADEMLNKLDPRFKDDIWYWYKGICARELDQLQQAEEYFNQIKNKNDKEYYLSLAFVYEKQSELILAVQTLKKYDRWSADSTCLFILERFYQKLKDYSEAHQCLEKIPNWQANEKAIIAKGFCYAGEKNYREAIKYFEKSLSIRNSNMVKIGECLAFCYFKERKYFQAIPLLQEIIKNKTDNPNFLFYLLCCYDAIDDKENYTKIYHQLVNFKSTNKHFLLNFSRFFRDKKNFNVAKNILKNITNWEYDKEALMELARVTQLQGEDAEALNYLHKIPNGESDDLILIEIGRHYQKLDDYDQAIATYLKLSCWKTRAALLRLGFCFSKKGDYDQAIQYTQMYDKWEKDIDFLRNLAVFYKDKGNIDESLKIFAKLLQNFGKQRDILINLAMTYESIKKYNEAIKTYLQVENIYLDKSATLMLAKCHAKNGDIDKAINHLIGSKWYQQKDPEYMLQIARFKFDVEEYDEAIKLIYSIPNYHTFKEILLSLAQFYQKLHRFDEAKHCYFQVPNAENDKDVLTLKAASYALQGPIALALKSYRELREKFPDNQSVAFFYFKFFLENNDHEVLQELDETLLKWPHMQKLYLLKANYNIRNNYLDAAFKILQQTLQKFPYCEEAYISLLRYYLRSNDQEGIRNTLTICKQKFGHNELFFEQIDNILKGGIFFEKINTINLLRDIKSIRVSLPDDVIATFKVFNLPPNTNCYLVGSVNHDLILNKPLPLQKDIDIVTTANPEFLLQKGFKRNNHLNELFTATIANRHVDCFCISDDYSTTGQSFITVNSKMRAFTVLCLFCDRDGNIYDPTGYGIGDLHQKMLRTVGDPTSCFREDPIRLLLAIKLIAQGFSPTIDLQEAIKNFAMENNSLNKDHLFAVTKKHLAAIENIKYVELLRIYGLFPKLFGIQPSKNDQTNLQQLLPVINHQPIYIPSINSKSLSKAAHATLFNQDKSILHRSQHAKKNVFHQRSNYKHG